MRIEDAPVDGAGDFTDILRESLDFPDAVDRLTPLVYDELRRLARSQLNRGGRGGDRTLDTTGLVHEAYLRLVDYEKATVRDRDHFFALSTRVMRHVLVDRARERLAKKRGGDRRRVDIDSVNVGHDDYAQAVLEIDEVLGRLTTMNERMVRVVECRFFAGLSEEETARSLGISRRSVQRDWVKARAWLRAQLGGESTSP